jgi:hypothetical protein
MLWLTLFTQDELWQELGSIHGESEHESESGNEIIEWWHRDAGDVTHGLYI